ncbi:NAD(P)-binding protein [Aaosphaeria arxii CBS 175.79]|uniref:NAD(P)-binding protein n=1 Tax=Aaosphaeria arxii CBS 175.79 TaxID=1450172 RepID=A0A6A5YAL3_9PLEO|nr:NAD(P)-binding protein [Aaosphaeria arxii CBS 175.79]KAF2022399.1 NAD(P)-binding protein [Aaosphaeria arxii CBS 175.79]
MVHISLIQQSNAQVDEFSAPRVAVFVGGTSGIGKITLAEISGFGFGFTAYVVGRKVSEESFNNFAEELRHDNAKANIVWVEGEVSLLSEVKRVCDHIKTLESTIDLLFMTTGYAPFMGRAATSEGVDISHALEYYSRICFVENLLPQLRASGSARVISVNSGGMETHHGFNVDDLQLKNAGLLWVAYTKIHNGVMCTLTLERLAEKNENHDIVFIHSHPHIVRTGNLYRSWNPGSWGLWFATWFIDPLLMLIAYTFKESAERHLYLVTSGRFGGNGPKIPDIAGTTTRGQLKGGLFLANHKCDTVKNEKELVKLRSMAQNKVWDTTYDIIGPYIA